LILRHTAACGRDRDVHRFCRVGACPGTITPPEPSVGLAIQTPHVENDEAALACWLPRQHSGDILFCWEHHRIPAIIEPLGQAVAVAALSPNAPDLAGRRLLVLPGLRLGQWWIHRTPDKWSP